VQSVTINFAGYVNEPIPVLIMAPGIISLDVQVNFYLAIILKGKQFAKIPPYTHPNLRLWTFRMLFIIGIPITLFLGFLLGVVGLSVGILMLPALPSFFYYKNN